MADEQTPIPQPSLQEASPHGKGDVIPANVSIGPTLNGFVEYLTPTDSVLKQKGGSLEVYKEVLRDDQVKAVFEQRRRAVVSAPWQVDDGADDATSKAAAEALRENLKAISFDRITDRQLFGIFYGYSVAEVMWEPRDNLVWIADVKVRDRSRFVFDRQHNVYLRLPGEGQYERMPDRKFWTISTGADHDDEPYGLGLGHWLYWPVWFKRNDIKFWLIFLEKFGMPTATGKVPAGKMDDAAFRTKALNALRAITTDSAVLIPEGVEVELLEAARSGTADYEGMCKAMDAAIAKIILSQTMTTDNGSSRSQAEVHQGVADKVVKSDADLLCESFNRTVVRWWTEWNFPGAVPPRVYRQTEPPEDLDKRADRDQKIKALGYEPTEDYIKETYGEGWVKSQNAEKMIEALGGGQPGAPRPDQMAQDFAEIAALAAVKSINRADQQALINAAQAFASKYEQILGPRVEQLLSFADNSGDYATFVRHLQDLIAQAAPAPMIEPVRRGNIFARLLGGFRAQR